MQEVVFKKPLFGKEIEIVVFNIDKSIVNPILEETYTEALRLQKIFNFYDQKSELSILNNKRKLKVSNELKEVLLKSLEFAKLTNGLYDISLGKAIKERKQGNNTKVNSSYKDIIIKDNEVTLNHEEVLIDLGSIAKGYIVDKLSEFLINQGIQEFTINGRGDIKVEGSYSHIIGIEHPRKLNQTICKLKLNNTSVATSGDYKQYIKDFSNSHILNQKDLISVTVVADNLTDADAYATILFVLDKKQREEIIKNNNLKVLTIDTNINIKKYNNFERFIYG